MTSKRSSGALVRASASGSFLSGLFSHLFAVNINIGGGRGRGGGLVKRLVRSAAKTIHEASGGNGKKSGGGRSSGGRSGRTFDDFKAERDAELDGDEQQPTYDISVDSDVDDGDGDGGGDDD